MAGEIIQRVDLQWDSKSADHSVSDFTKNIEKKFNRMHFDPVKQFNKDLDTAKKNVAELTKKIDASKNKKFELPINQKALDETAEQIQTLEDKIRGLNKQKELGTINKSGLKDLEKAKSDVEDLRSKYQQLKTPKSVSVEDSEEFKQLTEELEKQQNIVNSLEGSWNSMVDSMSLQEIETSLNDLNITLDATKSALANALDGKDGEESLDELKYRLEGVKELLEETFTAAGDNIMDSADTIELYVNRINELNDQIEAREFAISFYGQKINEVTAQIETLTNAKEKLNNSAEEEDNNHKRIQNSANKTINVYQKLGDTIKKVFTSIGKHTSKGLNLKKILGYAIGIRSLYAVFSKLRSAAKDGSNAVSDFQSKVQGKLSTSVKEINAAFAQMKNAVGVAVTPLLNALAPAIARIASLFTEAANAVARFFAVITGQKRVIQATDNQKAYAAALDKTKGSASDAAKALAKFDDLDVLDKDTGGGGSGSGYDAGELAQMFEDVEVDSWLKDMWEKADFTELGTMLGEKLRDTLSSIDWEGTVKPMARKLAKSLATLINGFVKAEDLGKSIGTTLAESLNTALEFFYTLAAEIDWGAQGQFAADILNSLFGTFDAKLAADTLNEWAHGLLLELMTALANTNWEELGYKIGEFLGNIDWVSIIAEVVAAVVLAIESLGELILGAGIGLITGILENISGMLENIDPEEHPVLAKIKEFIDTLIEKLGDLKDWFASDGKTIETDMGEIAEAFKAALETIIGIGAVVGLIALIRHLKGVKEASEKTKPAIQGLTDTVTTASSPWDNLTKGVGAFFDKLGTAAIISSVALLLKSFADVVDSVSQLIETMNDTNTTAIDLFFAMIAVLIPLGLAIAGVVAFIPPTAAITLLAIGAAIDLIATGVAKLLDAITNLISTPAKSLKEMIELLEKKGKDTVTKIQNINKEYRTTTQDMRTNTEKLKADLEKYLDELKNKVTNTTDSIKQTLEEFLRNIKEAVVKYITGSGTDSTKTLLSDFRKWVEDDLLTKLEDRFPKFESNFKSMINNMLGFLQKLADGAASAADAIAASINNLSVDIPSWVPTYGGNSWNPHLSGGVRTTIPRLATGAVLPPNQPFLAMLGDQKKGTNIEAPLDTIVEAMQQALNSMNYSGGNQEVVLNIDGTTLARLTIPNTLNELNRQGYNVKVLEGNKYGSR